MKKPTGRILILAVFLTGLLALSITLAIKGAGSTLGTSGGGCHCQLQYAPGRR